MTNCCDQCNCGRCEAEIEKLRAAMLKIYNCDDIEEVEQVILEGEFV